MNQKALPCIYIKTLDKLTDLYSILGLVFNKEIRLRKQHANKIPESHSLRASKEHYVFINEQGGLGFIYDTHYIFGGNIIMHLFYITKSNLELLLNIK